MRSKVTVRPPTLTCLTITGCLPSASWAGSACCPAGTAVVAGAEVVPGAEVDCAAPPPDESSSDPHATSPSMETTAKKETAVSLPRRCPMDALHPQTSQPAEESMLPYACRGEIGGDADPFGGHAKGLVGDQAPLVEVGRLELPYVKRLASRT